MKTIIEYEAYDGTHFHDRDKCVAYEQYAVDMLCKIMDGCNFYKDGVKISYKKDPHDLNNIEDLSIWWENEIDCADEIDIHEEIIEDAWVWVIDTWGYTFPEDVGHWVYNWNSFEWERA